MLVEIGILENWITSENPLHDMHMPCLLGAVVSDAWRVERPGREGAKKLHKNKTQVDGVEFWYTSPLENTVLLCRLFALPIFSAVYTAA